MQHSGIHSSEEVFLDTPTREKGQFTGDTVDISFANMIASGDRNASKRAIREIIDSATHSWKAASSGYCTAAQLPCSYPSIGTPGRVNAVYPNGDNMRDIPDYTLMMPDWVWRYYEQSGDKTVLADSYDALKSIANYVKTNVATSGDAAGLVYNLLGGTSSYQYGIIDWPAPMRYGYTFTSNAARTIHNAHAVGTLRSTRQGRARARQARGRRGVRRLGRRPHHEHQRQAAVNADGIYTDGLSSAAGNPQIANAAQHAQTYPIYYGVAPAAMREKLADTITAQGMKQGPMTWHVLLKALTDTGRYDQVVKLMTDKDADGPARTLAQQGTFMWEQWNPGCSAGWPCVPTNNESMSHGWGAWGLVDQIESLLGIKVTSPGAATVRIEPPAVDKADLHRVSGSAWTQRGTVETAWKRVNGTFVLDVKVPTNVKATVAIPNPGGVKYVGVGAGAPRYVGEQGGRAVFEVGSGRDALLDRRVAGPPGRRHGPGHAVALARRAGHVRRVHAGHDEGVHGGHDRQRDQHGGRRGADRLRAGPPDQRRVQPRRAAAGRAQHERRACTPRSAAARRLRSPAKVIAADAFDTGPLHAAGAIATRSGWQAYDRSSGARVSTASVASPAVLVTVASSRRVLARDARRQRAEARRRSEHERERRRDGRADARGGLVDRQRRVVEPGDRVRERLHARVVGVQVVAAVVGGQHPQRVGGVGERALEVDDPVPVGRAADELVDRHPLGVLLEAVVAGQGRDGERGERRHEDLLVRAVQPVGDLAQAVGDVGDVDGLVRVVADVVDAQRDDHRADAVVGQHVAIQARQAARVPAAAVEVLRDRVAADARVDDAAHPHPVADGVEPAARKSGQRRLVLDVEFAPSVIESPSATTAPI